jgi:hypothetical protein
MTSPLLSDAGRAQPRVSVADDDELAEYRIRHGIVLIMRLLVPFSGSEGGIAATATTRLTSASWYCGNPANAANSSCQALHARSESGLMGSDDTLSTRACAAGCADSWLVGKPYKTSPSLKSVLNSPRCLCWSHCWRLSSVISSRDLCCGRVRQCNAG